jgi:hypothetical protein
MHLHRHEGVTDTPTLAIGNAPVLARTTFEGAMHVPDNTHPVGRTRRIRRTVHMWGGVLQGLEFYREVLTMPKDLFEVATRTSPWNHRG